MKYNELADKIKALTAKADLTDSADTILDLPNKYVPEWSDYIGTQLSAGSLVAHNEIKYLVLQTLTSIESQPPSDTGMLALYQPYQGKYNYTWVYGEYTEIGFTRYHNSVLYKAIQDPNANIYSPDQTPAIWEVVTTT